WARDLVRGFQGGATQRGAGAGTATWTLNVPAGQYRVSATWREGPTRATNAEFTVLDGTTALGTARLNQRVQPRDFADGGARWADVGPVGQVYTTTGTNPLVVRLDAGAAGTNGVVVADAIRVERVNVPITPTVQDAHRFLEQATWGPTGALLDAVRAQ